MTSFSALTLSYSLTLVQRYSSLYNRILHEYYMVALIYEFYFLVVKDNILPLENKIPIFAPPCNILYMFSVNANAPRHARTFFLSLAR